jgi:hypothetical protein
MYRHLLETLTKKELPLFMKLEYLLPSKIWADNPYAETDASNPQFHNSLWLIYSIQQLPSQTNSRC